MIAILLAWLPQMNIQCVESIGDGRVVPYLGSRVPLRRNFRYSRLGQYNRLVPLHGIRHDIARFPHYL